MSVRKISFKRRKPNEERVPVLPIHDKYDQAIQVKGGVILLLLKKIGRKNGFFERLQWGTKVMQPNISQIKCHTPEYNK